MRASPFPFAVYLKIVPQYGIATGMPSFIKKERNCVKGHMLLNIHIKKFAPIFLLLMIENFEAMGWVKSSHGCMQEYPCAYNITTLC